MDFDEMEIRKKKNETNIEFQRAKLVTVGQTQAYERVRNNRLVIFIYGLFIRRIYSFFKRFCLGMHGSEIINDDAERASEPTIFQVYARARSTRSERKNSSVLRTTRVA